MITWKQNEQKATIEIGWVEWIWIWNRTWIHFAAADRRINLLSSLSTMQYLIVVFSRSSSRINLSRKRFFICAWDTYDTRNGQAKFTWQFQLHFAPAVCLIITNLCRLVNSRRQHEWISAATRRKYLGRGGRLMNFRSYMCICQKRTEHFVVWNSSSKWLKSL